MSGKKQQSTAGGKKCDQRTGYGKDTMVSMQVMYKQILTFIIKYKMTNKKTSQTREFTKSQ